MKFSLRWLQTYVDLTVLVSEMLERLTLAGTEVEHVTTTGVDDPHVVVGHILSSQPHPNADRLRVCQVADGSGTRQVVCGAKNYKDGDKVPLALPGAKLPAGLNIKESKLRGELSQGMLCSAKELALAEDAEGLLLLPPDAPVGKKFSEYLPGDTRFEVEITSNRPDLLSYLGLARELVALGVAKLKPLPAAEVKYPTTASSFTAKLSNPDLGPYYSAVHLQNVQVAPSPPWLQEAIAATGHRPINNVVDITNYVLFATGQPLHAFDAATLKGIVLEVRTAQSGEKLLALDDQTYPLTPEDLIIADRSGPIAIAGVMGGKPTGVTATTTEIVLETAWFLPATVRRTSRRLGLSSDSSYRYERRVDPGALLAARDRAVALLLELTGAKLVAAPFVAGKPPESRGPIVLRHERIAKLLGVEIPAAKVETLLTHLGCVKISSINTESTWQAPTSRYDLEREVDLIEEIARLHGLAAIPARLSLTAVPESPADRLHDRTLRLRHALAARGWDECVTDALIQRSFATASGAGKEIELLNPLNELYTHLRPDLRTSLLQVAAKNLAKGVASVKLFELGPVFRRGEKSTEEPLRLGLLVAGLGQEAAWYAPERAADFSDLSGTLDFLHHSAAIAPEAVLFAAPVAKSVLKEHGLKVPVFYAEIALEAWTKTAPAPELYVPVPAFPPVRRDLALVVPCDLPQEKVETALRQAVTNQGATAAKLLEDVRLFDVFRDEKGEKLATNQKSLAYALTFRAPDRTLTEKEIGEIFTTVRNKLTQEQGWSLRES